MKMSKNHHDFDFSGKKIEFRERSEKKRNRTLKLSTKQCSNLERNGVAKNQIKTRSTTTNWRRTFLSKTLSSKDENKLRESLCEKVILKQGFQTRGTKGRGRL